MSPYTYEPPTTIFPGTAASAGLTDLVLAIASRLVDQPETLRVNVRPTGPDSIVICVTCTSAAMGRLIGQHGNTARALRTIIQGAGMKAHLRVSLDIDAVPAPAQFDNLS